MHFSATGAGWRLIHLLNLIILLAAGSLAFSGDSAGIAVAPRREYPAGIVYLTPSDQYARTLTLTDPQTGETRPLLSEGGLEEFAVSPDGSAIAYTHNNPDGTADIWALNLGDDAPHPVTNCVHAVCHAPTWKPDDTQIAYARVDTGAGGASSRIWIVDLKTLHTELLLGDPQILGSSPAWSPDGQRIAWSDPTLPGIRIHDFAIQSDTLLENMQGGVGHWSPDGRRLVYPVLVRGLLGAQFYTHLEMADLDTTARARLSGPEDAPVEDTDGVWSPDGTHLLVARRYLDDRFTAGRQLYLLDIATQTVTPLVVDAAYNHSVLGWDATGRRIVFQRYSLVDPGALPEVWTYDLATQKLTRVAANAMLPAWVR